VFLFKSVRIYPRPEMCDLEFRQWAFGITDGTTQNKETPALWNALHKDIFECSLQGNMNKDISRMYKEYQKQKAR